MGKKKKAGFYERKKTKEANWELIERSGLKFTEHNNGSHIMLHVGERIIDVWPSTNKWMDKTQHKWRVNRGVPELIDHLCEAGQGRQ